MKNQEDHKDIELLSRKALEFSEEILKQKDNIIGFNIRRFRKAQKMTLKELGSKINLSEQAIGQYERGQRQPSAKITKALAQALNIPINELFNEEYHNQIINNNKDDKIEVEYKANLYELSKTDASALFNIIIEYMKNTKNYKIPLRYSYLFDISKKDVEENTDFIATSEINELINTICEFVEFKVHKLEKKREKDKEQKEIQIINNIKRKYYGKDNL